MPESRRWRCECSCGAVRDVWDSNLTSGKSKSCGHHGRAVKIVRHGHTANGRTSREYYSWVAMIQRCTNPKAPNFYLYGARGISVCRAWRKFENFFADMGKRPPGTTLERPDNDAGYRPGNCVWATPLQQAHNRRSSRFVRVRGKMMTPTEIARLIGVTDTCIRLRIKLGLRGEALLVPSKRPRDAKYAAVARERLLAEERGLSLREARAGQSSIFDVLGRP